MPWNALCIAYSNILNAIYLFSLNVSLQTVFESGNGCKLNLQPSLISSQSQSINQSNFICIAHIHKPQFVS